jgi:DNA-binding Lrp family transcriptional regulator
MAAGNPEKRDGNGKGARLSPIERRLIEQYQRGLPLLPRPYAAMAERLGASEQDVIEAIGRLREQGIIDRVGAVIAPHRAGWSTLAAMAVPPERLDEVAALVSACPEVNHNYEREHSFNLWFVVNGPDKPDVRSVLADIERRTGIAVLDLPLEKPFHIDLGFDIQWT